MQIIEENVEIGLMNMTTYKQIIIDFYVIYKEIKFRICISKSKSGEYTIAIYAFNYAKYKHLAINESIDQTPFIVNIIKKALNECYYSI